MQTDSQTERPAEGAYSIDGFCSIHGIGRMTFYELQRSGRGPRIMKVGRRVLISVEAAADWRRRMEEETAGAK